MQNLEKRVAALEKASPVADGMVIVIRFVKPGHLDAEIFRLRSESGEIWARQPGETEQEFTDRGSKEVRRNTSGVALLFHVD